MCARPPEAEEMNVFFPHIVMDWTMVSRSRSRSFGSFLYSLLISLSNVKNKTPHVRRQRALRMRNNADCNEGDCRCVLYGQTGRPTSQWFRASSLPAPETATQA